MTAEEIAEVKRLHGAGMLQREIAARFGCTQPTISLVLNGKSGPRRKLSTKAFAGALPEGMKLCGRCGPRPVSAFARAASKKDGLSVWCRTCKQEYASEPEQKAKRRVAHQQPHRRAARQAYYGSRRRLELHLRNRFNLSLAEYDAAMEAQESACAICRTAFASLSEMPHTDHDHATGKFRGILCGPCNKGIGHFRDDPKRLQNAITYLHREAVA